MLKVKFEKKVNNVWVLVKKTSSQYAKSFSVIGVYDSVEKAQETKKMLNELYKPLHLDYYFIIEKMTMNKSDLNIEDVAKDYSNYKDEH